MKSLKQHNAERRKYYKERENPKAVSNIACDHCGCELYYPNPNMSLMSNPPQKELKCDNPACQWCGVIQLVIV